MRTSIVIRGLPRTSLSFFFGAMFCAASIAAADQTYTLKLHLNRGEKWAFDASTTMKEKGQVLANGQVAQPIDQAVEQRRKGTIEVLAIENGVPSAMVVTFDAESANTGAAGGQQPPPFSLAGKTVHLSRKDGIITSDMGNDVDTPTVQEVSHMLDPDTSIYPKTPVTLNQEWDGDTTDLAKIYQLGADDKITIKCKLAAVRDVDGRQIADVGFSGTLIKHERDVVVVESRIVLEGTSHIDVQSGQVLGSEMTGKITARGAQQVNDPNAGPVNVTVSADGTIDVHQSVKPLNAAAPGVGVDFANAHPGNSPAGAPHPETPAAAPDDAAATFSGSYKGDQITLDLSSSAGQYSGSLTVGDKKFPVSAKSDGGKLAGHFESEGTRFEFSASIQGNILTLSSEGNTYSLKKATANPLARPAPKNPLAQ